ncbi:MAG: hypothetical protein A2X25_12965 [Chloroflexi bacterium GWB2_49_20]|nr:MAG: hypothetical protein A2X25_12965 [Chloroflexi bacterium GWB2_49_20]OGN78372.1 MAG: hypothetical protein A2X26_01235 [Chloroflexi bacterium GWC2_49_37]OGN84164.1 MAG: hypothetical protein A2X27_14455 [Chloroflexi bacterium GWD2_49_16]HBG75182.1 hypothetical protein [Anaerolineae bacterium]HCC79183.1 hypothetical protein [Anaerolineae bacterium]
MRNRWLIYLVVGMGFGFADWYFLDLLALLSQNQSLNENLLQTPEYIHILILTVLVISNYGIWLIPVIPTAIYEMKRSHSLLRAAISAVIVWSAAMLSYYAYYAFLLLYVGLPNLNFMLFSNRQSTTYWADLWPPFRRVILVQFVEWIGIAVIGGMIVGTLSAYVYQQISKKRKQRGAF